MIKPGESDHVFIIGEAGVNHNGDIKLAKELIDVATEARVDAVKFQTFKPGEITGKYAVKSRYMKDTTYQNDDRYEVSRKLALTYDEFIELKNYSDKKNVLFLTTPDGYQSLNFVVNELNIRIIKLGSTELNNLEFIKEAAKKDRPIILSTGMGTLGEVERAVEIIRKYNSYNLTVLHCTSEYPAPYDEINLLAMVTMRDALHVEVGFSDHTEGFVAPISAVALGAKVIEKHFTADKSLQGPDHKASMSPDELKELVRTLRIAEKIRGSGIKWPSPSEIANMASIRRGVVAAYDLKKGVRLTKNMITAKRPFVEIEPGQIDILVGMKLNRDLLEDEPIQWTDVK